MSVSGELSANVRVIQSDYVTVPPRADEVLTVEVVRREPEHDCGQWGARSEYASGGYIFDAAKLTDLDDFIAELDDE